MPRLPPSLLRHAYRISPHLAALLPACRDLAAARNELRWIREHVLSSSSPSPSSPSSSSSPPSSSPPSYYAAASTTAASSSSSPSATETEARVARLCARRGRGGAPLQYVLGSQPFGPLDIACRPGVLIPRPETEAWVCALADAVVLGGSLLPSTTTAAATTRPPLRVVDFCTGTGCIALLLSALLLRRRCGVARPSLSVYGFDVEDRAVALARRNLVSNVRRGLLGEASSENRRVVFERADVFSEDWRAFLSQESSDGGVREGREERGEIDILVSNPPYISADGFNRDTGRSVRNHEPKLALVPDPVLLRRENGGSGGGGVGFADTRPEDVFYARLLQIAEQTGPKIVVFEVGDLAQAARVVEMAMKRGGWEEHIIEIWRDCPDMVPGEDEAQAVLVSGVDIPVKGSGNGRVVVLRRDIDGRRE